MPQVSPLIPGIHASQVNERPAKPRCISVISQGLLKELRGGLVGPDEIFPEKKIVDFIGIDDLLKWHMVVAQPLHQINHLVEWNVAIVISLNKQDGLLPLADGRIRGGFPRQFSSLLQVRSGGRAFFPVL